IQDAMHGDHVLVKMQRRGGVSGAQRAEGYILDRKSTRLNSSHLGISYAVFCLKKKKAMYRNLALLSLILYVEYPSISILGVPLYDATSYRSRDHLYQNELCSASSTFRTLTLSK